MIQNKKDLHEQTQDFDSARPAARAMVMTFGKIAEVDEEERQVKVRDITTGDLIGMQPEGSWLRILNAWEDITQRFGPLDKGFWVRIWWRGTHVSRNPIVEVIGDPDIDFFKSRPQNEGQVGTHKILSPGV